MLLFEVSKYTNAHIRMSTHQHNGSTSHQFFKEASEKSQWFGTSNKHTHRHSHLQIYFDFQVLSQKVCMHTFILIFIYYASCVFPIFYPFSLIFYLLGHEISGSKFLSMYTHAIRMYTFMEISGIGDTCASLPSQMQGAALPQGVWESITVLLRQKTGYWGTTTCQRATRSGCHHLIFT